MYADLVLFGLLMIARYVFHIECFEWYCPEWATRWLESGVPDLTECGTLLTWKQQ
jgi:hypothetical protein